MSNDIAITNENFGPMKFYTIKKIRKDPWSKNVYANLQKIYNEPHLYLDNNSEYGKLLFNSNSHKNIIPNPIPRSLQRNLFMKNRNASATHSILSRGNSTIDVSIRKENKKNTPRDDATFSRGSLVSDRDLLNIYDNFKANTLNNKHIKCKSNKNLFKVNNVDLQQCKVNKMLQLQEKTLRSIKNNKYIQDKLMNVLLKRSNKLNKTQLLMNSQQNYRIKKEAIDEKVEKKNYYDLETDWMLNLRHYNTTQSNTTANNNYNSGNISSNNIDLEVNSTNKMISQLTTKNDDEQFPSSTIPNSSRYFPKLSNASYMSQLREKQRNQRTGPFAPERQIAFRNYRDSPNFLTLLYHTGKDHNKEKIRDSYLPVNYTNLKLQKPQNKFPSLNKVMSYGSNKDSEMEFFKKLKDNNNAKFINKINKNIKMFKGLNVKGVDLLEFERNQVKRNKGKKRLMRAKYKTEDLIPFIIADDNVYNYYDRDNSLTNAMKIHNQIENSDKQTI